MPARYCAYTTHNRPLTLPLFGTNSEHTRLGESGGEPLFLRTAAETMWFFKVFADGE